MPLAWVMVPSTFITVQYSPCDITSGLMRPSEELPKDEKSVLTPAGVTAPTVSTSSASAGTLMSFHALEASLPAELQRIIPLLAIIEAELEEMC